MANLTVTHSESIVLKGQQFGGTNTIVFTGINEIFKRILTIPESETTIATFGAAASAGNYIAANVKYIRFTNQDATNYIHLVLKNEFNHEVSLKLDAGQSFVFNADNGGGVVDTINANQLAFGFTNATCDYNNDPTVNCDADKQILPGLRVSGTGVPADTTVISVNTPGAVTQFELSASTTGGAETDNTFTFTSGLNDLADITAEADSGSCDLEVLIASV